jgi:rSAM/selenodomain-associated transferase 2
MTRASRHVTGGPGLRISIIVPVLNEAEGIAAALGALQPLRGRGHEVVVVDGGSADSTVALARPLADQVLSATRGRAAQMNAGAQAARGDAFLFLHADTRLPGDADALVAKALARRRWGRFDVRIDSPRPALALVGVMMNLRSRLSGIATGDQAMFARRTAFAAAGGFPALALMEDIALSSQLRRGGRPACLRERVLTSGRRWERNGVFATILLMWRLRLMFFLGTDPRRLARLYERKA